MTTLVPGVQRLPVVRGFVPSPPRNCTSMRDGKVLVLAHRLGRLAVDHHAAVADGPAGAASALVADEAVLDAEDVVRERLLVEQVAEAAAEGAGRICRSGP